MKMKITTDGGQEIEGEVISFDDYYRSVEEIYQSTDNDDEWGILERKNEQDYIIIKLTGKESE